MIEELDSSLDKVDLVMLRDVKDYLRKMVRCSITRRTAFSKFVGLQRLTDYGFTLKLRGLNHAKIQMFRSTRSLPGGKPRSAGIFIPRNPEPKGSFFLGGASERDNQFSGAHRPTCPPA